MVIYLELLKVFSDCVHMMPAHFENGGKLTVRNSLQDLVAKEMYLHLRIDQSRSKSVEKFSVFIIYKCSLNIVSKMFRFQSLAFSKFAGKNSAVFV